MIHSTGTREPTAGCGYGPVGTSVTQDTTGSRARETRGGGAAVGAAVGCAAMAYPGNCDKDSSVSVSVGGGVCIGFDTDKGFGFGRGFGIGAPRGGGPSSPSGSLTRTPFSRVPARL